MRKNESGRVNKPIMEIKLKNNPKERKKKGKKEQIKQIFLNGRFNPIISMQ